MIVDAFTFFNELELLDLRLNHLDPVVDKFVLVESTKTHSGLPKPLYFDDNKDLFKPFHPKILHIVVNNMPDVPNWGDRWILENYQRNAINEGLRVLDLQPDDYILIGDLDEIPKADLVIKKYFGVYDQVCFMYYLNVLINEHWNGTVGMTYRTYKERFASPQEVRNYRNSMEPIKNGGWHFAWLGGYDRVKQKLNSFAHSELDNENTYSTLKASVENLSPLWSPGSDPMRILPINDLFPDYLLENKEKFEGIIYEKFDD